MFQFSSVQSLSRVRLFVTPWIAAHQASLFITNSRSSLRPSSIESVMPSSHLILCRPLLLLPPVPPSIRVFSNESTGKPVEVMELQQAVSQFSHSIVSDSLQPYRCSMPGLPVLHCLLERERWTFELVMSSNHLVLFCPILPLPWIFPRIRIFSNESALHIRWPKYWCFSFSISPSSEYSGLISFRMDWLDLLAVQETLKSLQQYSSKASILQCSAFFMVQLSHLYMTTGKIIALTR